MPKAILERKEALNLSPPNYAAQFTLENKIDGFNH
jgi:hypothetical protein